MLRTRTTGDVQDSNSARKWVDQLYPGGSAGRPVGEGTRSVLARGGKPRGRQDRCSEPDVSLFRRCRGQGTPGPNAKSGGEARGKRVSDEIDRAGDRSAAKCGRRTVGGEAMRALYKHKVLTGIAASLMVVALLIVLGSSKSKRSAPPAGAPEVEVVQVERRDVPIYSE